MSKIAAFNTLQYSQALERAGVAKPQADAQAELLNDILTTEIVKKSDLDFAVLSLERKLDVKTAELDKKIDNVEKTLIKSMWKIAAAQITLIATIAAAALAFRS